MRSLQYRPVRETGEVKKEEEAVQSAQIEPEQPSVNEFDESVVIN